jgi:hypothetical protein
MASMSNIQLYGFLKDEWQAAVLLHGKSQKSRQGRAGWIRNHIASLAVMAAPRTVRASR